MDLVGQKKISVLLNRLKYLLVFILISLLFIVSDNDVYAYKNIEKEKTLTLEDQMGESKKNIKEESDVNTQLNTTSVFNSQANNIFNITLQGSSVKIIDNIVGYLPLVEDKYLLLEQICNSYVNDLSLDTKNIVQIEVVGNIDNTLENDRLSVMNSSGELSNEVYDSIIINNSLSDIKIKVNLEELKVVEPNVVIEESNDLYMGESATIEGVEGRNLVCKEIIYDGLNENVESVMDEKVIEPAINTVIKKGIKNPYYDGVAFLSRPTEGGYLSSTFGEVRASSVHKGIDIAKGMGEKVKASFDGKVIKAGYNNGGYGNLIVLEHENNMKTYYAHLSDIYVNPGDIVKKDDIIGTIGSTGNSTGPHLHFELRVNNSPVDPIKYIKQ